MKRNLLFIILLLLGWAQAVFAQSGKVVEILDCNLTRIEPEQGDYALVFEVECQYSGVKDIPLGFVIVPLDSNLEVMVDSNGEPLMCGDMYQMLDDNGSGALEVSIPLSYFPKNAEEFIYSCIVIDDETSEAMADTGPVSFTAEQVRKLMRIKASKDVYNIFDWLSEGRLSGKSDKKWGEYDCIECGGSGKCKWCSGMNSECQHCGGSGKCTKCHGEGVEYRVL